MRSGAVASAVTPKVKPQCVYATLDECERWMQPEWHLCTPSQWGDEID
jgi:hypothetical protein